MQSEKEREDAGRMGQGKRSLVLSPHNDDAVLFGAFTILREKPLVLTILDSAKQGNAYQRRTEDLEAMTVLDAQIEFLGVSDANPDWALLERLLFDFGQPEMVYAPCPEEGGNKDHNAIGEMAGRIFQNVTYYMTYTKSGRSVGVPVPYEPEWVGLKLRALACYESQIGRRDNVDHFLRPQYEYISA